MQKVYKMLDMGLLGTVNPTIVYEQPVIGVSSVAKSTSRQTWVSPTGRHSQENPNTTHIQLCQEHQQPQRRPKEDEDDEARIQDTKSQL